MASESHRRDVPNPKSKSFRISPDGHWQARPFTDRFGSSEFDVLYQFPLAQGGTNVLFANTMRRRTVRQHGLPKRCEPGKGAGSLRGVSGTVLRVLGLVGYRPSLLE